MYIDITCTCKKCKSIRVFVHLFVYTCVCTEHMHMHIYLKHTYILYQEQDILHLTPDRAGSIASGRYYREAQAG